MVYVIVPYLPLFWAIYLKHSNTIKKPHKGVFANYKPCSVLQNGVLIIYLNNKMLFLLSTSFSFKQFPYQILGFLLVGFTAFHFLNYLILVSVALLKAIIQNGHSLAVMFSHTMFYFLYTYTNTTIISDCASMDFPLHNECSN